MFARLTCLFNENSCVISWVASGGCTEWFAWLFVLFSSSSFELMLDDWLTQVVICYVGFFNYLQTRKIWNESTGGKKNRLTIYSYMWKIRSLFSCSCMWPTPSKYFQVCFSSVWWLWICFPFSYSLVPIAHWLAVPIHSKSKNHEQKSIRAEIKTWKAQSWILNGKQAFCFLSQCW